MRTRNQAVLTAVRWVDRAVANPRQLRTAGQAGSQDAIVRHVGCRSGRTYQTPVTAIPTEDGFLIALPYGRHTDWLANVLTAGSAILVHNGHDHHVEHPQILSPDDAAERLPARELRLSRFFGVQEYLHLTPTPPRLHPLSERASVQR